MYLSNALPGSLTLERELIFWPVSGGCRTRRAYKKYVLTALMIVKVNKNRVLWQCSAVASA
jgi:hypothetical protein